GLSNSFDLVFIDADKRNYPHYLDLIVDKVKTGGFILADNVLWGGKVADPDIHDEETAAIRKFNTMVLHHKGLEQIILPLRDGIAMIRKIGV
ncbi:MAG: methyltransferase, partial [Bacteroidetes bacterium]|nr:methyltransferase [Bacteroidota bacterium]